MVSKFGFTIILVLLVGKAVVSAQQVEAQLQYVEKYKSLAIWEMGRRGVPASIKLGQAILESRWGTTDLAVIANNHFGIKCGGREAWNGPQYYKVDDEYDRLGQALKSCFRQYNSVEESYIAHSEFLRNPLKEERYGFLFRLDPTDYRGWAFGLKKAGYATDPKYHLKLIRIIEELSLAQYDRMSFKEAVASNRIESWQPARLEAKFEALVGSLIPGYYQGRVQEALPGRQELKPLAPLAVYVLSDLRNHLFSDAHLRTAPASALLLTYREVRDHPARVLRSFGQRNPHYGRSRYRGKPMWHIVRPNELMADISRMYHIELSALYTRNLLDAGSEVAAGQRIKLKGSKTKSAPEVFSLAAQPRPSGMVQASFRADPLLLPLVGNQRAGGRQESPLPAQGGVVPLPLPDIPVGSGSSPSFSPWNTGSVEARYHIVQPGDTLYRISVRYGVSLGALREMNRINGDIIVAGTALRLQ
jgi:LysM repeat protein